MRAILVLLIILVVVAIALVATGYINVDQTRQAALPKIEVKGGQAPAFDVQTANVSVHNETVQVPTVDVKKPR
ncbi:hypothetical protein [Sphingomonas morindae]|uniref:Uncharacterized protein n=1 Tax=Sphingomonas morindae TaxID=1541170 RepID=A0ABY4X8T2_9SPHN|nr:hypothetical protein [Sphingomonas morindae]USI73342.1 hypothetical protein LHA26_02340 [Sphingomonas morindae]